MKQFLLISGLSLVSSGAFSQQQLSNKKQPVTNHQISVETNTGQEHVSDTIAVSSMNKVVIEPVVPVESVTRENQVSSKGQKKPVINTTKKTPE